VIFLNNGTQQNGAFKQQKKKALKIQGEKFHFLANILNYYPVVKTIPFVLVIRNDLPSLLAKGLAVIKTYLNKKGRTISDPASTVLL